MIVALLALAAHGGAHNDWTGPVELPKNTVSVHLHSVEGDVRISVDPAATEAVVKATDFRPGRACVLEVVKEKRGRTEIRFDAKDQEDPKLCRTEFDVVVPPAMAVEVALGVGKITASGMQGALTLASGRGAVELKGLAGPVKAAVSEGDLRIEGITGFLEAAVAEGNVVGKGAGDLKVATTNGRIRLDGLTGKVEAATSVGDILLTFAEAPGGDLLLNAGSGNVVVDLPAGTRVRSRLSSMTGTTTCELPEGDDLEVVAVAGSGSVRVH